MRDGPSSANLFWTAAALGVLLAATIIVAELPLGGAGLIVTLAIAAAKALLVAVVFMHLHWSSPVQRLFAGAALFWLAILFALTFADYLTRNT